MSSSSSILSRPLNVFSLPPELLSNLSVRSIQDTSADSNDASSSRPNQRKEDTSNHRPNHPGVGLRCQTCPNAEFDTVEEQREHFRSDWHRYNAKARLTGRAVTAEEWDGMMEGVSSISGSASSASSDSSASQRSTKLSRLLARQHVSKDDGSDGSEEAELADRRRRAQLRTAIIWFEPNSPLDNLGISKDTQIGAYRALFPPFESASDYLKALHKMQLPALSTSNGTKTSDESHNERRITMLMVAGGHFAGMVVGLRQKAKNERQEVKGAGEIRVLQHKTFHRYTTRKKQGGSQGLNDNAKSKAISAGAMLRRYGEQALQEEIRALLLDWREDLAASERIFIRASTHGKKSFWGYDGAVLDKSDERIRTFPFPTRRPTLQELLRSWHELTRVKISHLSQEALAALDEAYIASLQPKRAVPAKSAPQPAPVAPSPVPQLSAEEQAKLDRSKRIDEMIRKDRVEPLQGMYERFPDDFTISYLGLAASVGSEDVVRYLLESTAIDPSLPLEGGRRAYELASTKGVRNIFRRVAFDHPEKWDWAAARVPSGLSEEAEQAQEKKKLDRRKGLREKMKERQAAREDSEEVDKVEIMKVEDSKIIGVNGSQTTVGPQKLGGAKAGAGDGLAGLSGDMRMQIERERRARAAEARFKASG